MNNLVTVQNIKKGQKLTSIQVNNFESSLTLNMEYLLVMHIFTEMYCESHCFCHKGVQKRDTTHFPSRHMDTLESAFHGLCSLIRAGTNGGAVTPIISVFPQRDNRNGIDKYWPNHNIWQTCFYWCPITFAGSKSGTRHRSTMPGIRTRMERQQETREAWHSQRLIYSLGFFYYWH